MKFFSVFFTGSLAFLACIPFAGGLSKERADGVAEFFRRMHKPINFAAEVGAGNDRSQLQILGRLALAVAVFIGLMVLLPNPTSGRVTIVILAATIGAVALVMMWLGRSGPRKIPPPPR
jgi:SSS family solute:Na+ symporter